MKLAVPDQVLTDGRPVTPSMRTWMTLVSRAVGGQAESRSNVLLNGGFSVWQRGTSIAGAASRVYGPDRWSFWRASGATGMTVSRQTGSDPSRYCVRVQRDSGNASTAVVNFAQALTTENTYPLRGKRLGVRFRARAGANYSSASSALTVQFLTGTGTDQHPSTPYTGAATQVSTAVVLTTSFQYFVVDLGTVAGTVTEAALNFTFTPVGTAGTNDYFDISEAQLVSGYEPTVGIGGYAWRSFDEEQSACEAYYEKSFPYATAPAQNAGTTGAFIFSQIAGAATLQNAPAMVLFRGLKRSSPTMTLYNPSAANAQIRNITTGTDYTGSTSGTTNVNGWIPQGTSPAGSGAGEPCTIHYTAEAEI